jgi:hypothetical protein
MRVALMSGQHQDPTGREAVRFEATVHPRTGEVLAAAAVEQRVADLDLDRVPDAAGELRVLLTPEDVARLTAQGFEVRVQQTLPVRPLDPGLIADDAAAREWFDTTVRGQ